MSATLIIINYYTVVQSVGDSDSVRATVTVAGRLGLAKLQ